MVSAFECASVRQLEITISLLCTISYLILHNSHSNLPKYLKTAKMVIFLVPCTSATIETDISEFVDQLVRVKGKKKTK